MTDRITQELGEGYEERILDWLGSESVIKNGGCPTWWLTHFIDARWVGKSYWVRKVLIRMEKEGEVESYNTRKYGIGWYWALKGKMNIDWI